MCSFCGSYSRTAIKPHSWASEETYYLGIRFMEVVFYGFGYFLLETGFRLDNSCGSILRIERNFILMKKRVLYFVYGVRSSSKNCLWFGLVLLAWNLMFDKKALFCSTISL